LEPEHFWQFTALINFRYIQNRVIPADILKLEAPKFRKAVMKRLRIRKKEETDDFLRAIDDAAATTVVEASKTTTEDIKSIKKLVIGTPLETASLLALSGFGAEISTGAIITDDALGAGSQAYVMFLLLKSVDTNYGGTFGWRQGAVWCVEEPESSLHMNLEQKLAMTLRSWTENRALRLQIIATTHSEVITTAANTGFLVELDGARTAVRSKNIPELIYLASTSGVSGPLEPVLCFPTNTVVLVEGPLDRRIFEYVSQRTSVACGFKFTALHELDPTQYGSGVGSIIEDLRLRGPLIQNRAINSPFIILFDYSVEGSLLNKARKYYGANGHQRVLRMNINHAHPKVSNSFSGIERFYPKALYIQARKKGVADIAVDQHGNVSIDKAKLTAKVKRDLADLFCQGPDIWCKRLEAVLKDIESAALPPNSQLPLR
jgi:hypothetical protein